MKDKVLAALLGSLVVACDDRTPEQEFYQCDDVSAQIEEALRRDIETGILPPDAVACELTPDSFGPGLDPEMTDLRLGDYIRACEIQADVCSGVRVPVPVPAEDPPPQPGPPEQGPPPLPPPVTTN